MTKKIVKKMSKKASKLKPLPPIHIPWEAFEKKTARKYADERCGVLHLSWMVDRFWSNVAQDVLIPGFLAIYDKLVDLGHDEANKRNIFNGQLFYVPVKGRKVLVFTTQSRDFLITMAPTTDWELPDNPKLPPISRETHSLHIRRLWRPYKNGAIWNLKASTKSIHSILDSVETFEEFADDHSQYPQRPSLDLYRKIKFNLDKFQDSPRFYGDLRDAGFVYSSGTLRGRCEGTVGAFHDLEAISTIYLGSLAEELQIKVPCLKGYGR